MPPRHVYRSAVPLRLLCAGLFVGLALAAQELLWPGGRPGALGVVTLASALALTGLFALALYNRARRPAFEIRDGVLEYGSIFRPGALRGRIALDDVAALEPGGPAHLIATTRAGRRIRVPLHEVPPEARAELWRALERQLRERPGGAA